MTLSNILERGLRMAIVGFVVASCGYAFAEEALPAPVEPDTGRLLYGRCTGCHQLDRNAMGPLHCGVVGRAAAAVEGFRYSEAMQKSGIVWSPDALDAFLEDPAGAVPGTKMLYDGVPDAGDRQVLIAWLAWATAHSERCQPASRGD